MISLCEFTRDSPSRSFGACFGCPSREEALSILIESKRKTSSRYLESLGHSQESSTHSEGWAAKPMASSPEDVRNQRAWHRSNTIGSTVSAETVDGVRALEG